MDLSNLIRELSLYGNIYGLTSSILTDENLQKVVNVVESIRGFVSLSGLWRGYPSDSGIR
jgi:hypothetical protein